VSQEDFIKNAEAEAQALETIRNLKHPHLIKATAYYKLGHKHFFVFPWAESGNLWDFWEKDPQPLDSGYLKWVFTQLLGLAWAIRDLHNSKDGAWRHGDLKPENIMCFEDKSNVKNSGRCILVIADVGLARVHAMATDNRPDPTATQSGTVMYWPPERELPQQQARTRRYDLWSLGCIYLEFLIWLLFGTSGLRRFRKELRGDKFYVIQPNQAGQMESARVNEDVQKWMDAIKKDPRCPQNTALGRLLQLIETRLLVVKVGGTAPGSDPATSMKSSYGTESDVSSNSSFEIPRIQFRAPTFQADGTLIASGGNSSNEFRAYAPEMHETMEHIVKSATSSGNVRIEWMGKSDKPRPEGPKKFGDSLTAPQASAAAGKPRSKDLVVRYP
jgi:serine/threonine protein kinase